MIKERRYETYGEKDGTIDIENKKSKRINTKIRGGRGRCRCCRDHFNSGSPDRTCHHFQRAADRTGAEHSFKDRQTE